MRRNKHHHLPRASGRPTPGCWSHGRRRLVEAARGGDKSALAGLQQIAGRFLVERQSAIAGETAEQRLVRRKEHSAPLVEKLRVWIDQQRGTTPPRTPLG